MPELKHLKLFYTLPLFCFKTGGLIALAWTFSGHAHAGGLENLASFLRTQQSGSATFTQNIRNINPATGVSNTPPKISMGEFSFMRPRQFRFDYIQPFAQSIVADGETLWFYDVDLEQVGYKNQDQALGHTPVALITTAQNVQDLEQRFSLQELPQSNGLHWVEAKPKSTENIVFVEARIGFRNGALEKLIIQDPLGQRSELTFGPFSTSVTPDRFHFEPPAEVDIVGGF